jgi:hypothetical protein
MAMRYAERSWSSHTRLMLIYTDLFPTDIHSWTVCGFRIFTKLTRRTQIPTQRSHLATHNDASTHIGACRVLKPLLSRRPQHPRVSHSTLSLSALDVSDYTTFNTPATMMVPDSVVPAQARRSDGPTDGQLVEVKIWDKHRNNPMAEVVLVSKDKIGFRVEAWYIQKHR